MLPWTEGMIDRSAADLVMCRLRDGEIPVLGNVGYCRHVVNIMLYKICGNQFRVSNITVLSRGAAIQVGYESPYCCHDSIHITVRKNNKYKSTLI